MVSPRGPDESGIRMRARTVVGLLSLFALATAAPAAAQVSGPKSLHFVGGSGVGFNGWQVGTYQGTLDGTPLSIWCTDFFNHSANATVWQSGLGGSTPDLSKTRFGTLSGQPELYRRAAALTTLFGSQPTTEWGYIHYAIWQLMSDPIPHTGVSAGAQVQIDSWVSWSLVNYTTFDYSNMYVLTDVRVTGQPGCQGVVNQASCGAQEYLTGYLTEIPQTVTPEPAVIGLMAFGLVGLSGVNAVRRRRKQL